MLHLAAILVPLALLGGFLLLTAFEARRGARVLSGPRAYFDASVESAFGAASRLDLPAFLWHAAKDAGARLAHDAVALVIFLLRALESLLLRAVRALRSRRPGLTTLASRGSAFVEHISRHKRALRGEEEPTPPPQE